MKTNRKAFDMIRAAAAALVIISISVSATVWFRPVYYFDIGYLQIPQKSGYTAEECRQNYDALIDYNVIFGEKELKFPDMDMSEQGRIHFKEVKDIFIPMQIMAAAGIAVFVLWLVTRFRRGIKEKNVRWMRYTVILVITVCVCVAAAMLADWQGTFAFMHSVLFDNDYWLFNPDTDPVIKILPDTFFFHCGGMIVILTAVETAALEYFYRRIRNGKGRERDH
ncbi:MAG: TIGR01906 family membrane protein [Anaerovoracaceae bacterium]|nr:TIGR01906 family membrane protein [Anaerovoracaceae bacterium]